MVRILSVFLEHRTWQPAGVKLLGEQSRRTGEWLEKTKRESVTLNNKPDFRLPSFLE